MALCVYRCQLYRMAVEEAALNTARAVRAGQAMDLRATVSTIASKMTLATQVSLSLWYDTLYDSRLPGLP